MKHSLENQDFPVAEGGTVTATSNPLGTCDASKIHVRYGTGVGEGLGVRREWGGGQDSLIKKS